MRFSPRRISGTGGAWLHALVVSRVAWAVVAAVTVLSAAPGTPVLDALRRSLVHWDATAYLRIATTGYPANVSYLDAFMPGYPLLVHDAALVVQDYVLSAWIVNLVAEALALYWVQRLVRQERDPGAAAFAVWLVALAPTAVFLVAPFTESAFIAAAAYALLCARRGRPYPAAVAAAAATIIHLPGLAMIPALALETLQRHRFRPTRDLGALLLIPLPLLAYCAYMQAHTGDALAALHAQTLPSFSHAAAPPWVGLITDWNTMLGTQGETQSVFAREVAFGLLGALLCAGMWVSSRIPRSFALYCTVAWLLTASVSFWRSEPRYILALFPAAVLVADMTARARRVRPGLVLASGILMCAGVSVYAQGRWLG